MKRYLSVLAYSVFVIPVLAFLARAWLSPFAFWSLLIFACLWIVCYAFATLLLFVRLSDEAPSGSALFVSDRSARLALRWARLLSPFLPARVATEQLGDSLEHLHDLLGINTPRLKIARAIAWMLFWLVVNSAREAIAARWSRRWRQVRPKNSD